MALKIQEIQPSQWKSGKLNSILNQIRKKKVLVIGDVGLDRYTIGSVERISPEAPVPIVLVQEEKLKLGLAANVADNIQALGGEPFLVGVIGEDRGAEDFCGLLTSSGISEADLIVDGSRRTVLKERVVSDRQQLVRIDYESQSNVHSKVEAEILKKYSEVLGKVDAVIVEDYAKGMLTPKIFRTVFALAHKAKKKVSVDPNLKTPVGAYRGATVLTPNTKEAEHLSGIKIRDSQSLADAGAKILKSAQSDHVVITLGKEGMAIFTRGNNLIRIIPTYAREVYDVSGAGDTVIAVLTLALAAGAGIEEAAVLGNLAAGVEVGKRGTATVSPEEIRAALKTFGKSSSRKNSKNSK